jgi:hypothetical protein
MADSFEVGSNGANLEEDLVLYTNLKYRTSWAKQLSED